ncbi:related to ammecr1 protein [Cephalotrichum gorgonifer]|uniref:Related to ammecr1 protein n=1 Tax=Cephalotrichum gorgonifer TaxID=2041049 RepID=A0AAE8MVB8_9PEZI|nr:related to ammecr1 protein [Cephalotrichum gorgonifer]
MATTEHCLYAFEALAANLERREPLDLEDVQKSWAAYLKSLDSADSTRPAKPLPALQRLTSPTSGASSSSSSTMSLATDTPATSVTSLGEDDIRESPLFITWNVISDEGHSLRGCIGTFEDQELEDGISSYAITAALHDTRFPPVRLSELPTLGVSVTLLTDFEDCDDSMDWTLGVHGLRISFVYHGRRYGATYLPDVATEQGWTKEETLVSLMRKAGWVGRKDKWREVELDCVRYQGKKASLEFGEYKKWRGWVDETKWQA